MFSPENIQESLLLEQHTIFDTECQESSVDGRGSGGYSGAMEMLDAPEIRRMERWGALKPLEEPRCPVCGETCEWIYIWKEREIVGCENCVRRCDALSKGEEECGRIRWIGC